MCATGNKIRSYLLDIDEIAPNVVHSAFDNIILDGGLEEWSGGTPDNWGVSASNPPTNTQTGEGKADTTKCSGAFAMLLNRNPGGDGYVYQSIPNYREYRGGTVSFSAMVKTDTASRVQLAVYDGVSRNWSAAHTGSDDWEKISVEAAAINASATELTFEIWCLNGPADVYLDNLMATPSSVSPEFVPPASSARSTIGGVSSFNDRDDGGTNLIGAVYIKGSSGITLSKDTVSNSVNVSVDSSSNITSISKSGDSLLFGDVTLSEGNNITLTRVASDIAISGPTNIVETVKAEGEAAIYGDVTFIAGTNITLTQATNEITISAASGSGVGTRIQDVNSNTYVDVQNAIYPEHVLMAADGALVFSASKTNGTIIYSRQYSTFASTADSLVISVVSGVGQRVLDADTSETHLYAFGNEVLEAYTNGEITLPSNSAIDVYGTASQNIANNTLATVSFEQALLDRKSEWSGNKRFTAKQPGRYHIDAQVTYSPIKKVGSTYVAGLYIYVNNFLVHYTLKNINSNSSLRVPMSKTISLGSNDYVEIQTYQNSGSNAALFVDGTSYNKWLSIDKIS